MAKIIIERPKEFCSECQFARVMSPREIKQSGQILFCDLFAMPIIRTGKELRSRPLRKCRQAKEMRII